MKHLNTILTVLTVATAIGCSNHTRTSDSLLTTGDVQAILQDVEGAQASSAGSGDLSAALALNQPGGSVYIVSGPTPTLQIANVVSFLDFSFLGLGTNFNIDQISDARVIFFFAPDNSVALIIGIKAGSDSFSYSAFTGSGGISNGEFTAELTGGSGTAITVKSYDIEGDDLAGVIQLKLWKSDGTVIGKVPILTGFAL